MNPIEGVDNDLLALVREVGAASTGRNEHHVPRSDEETRAAKAEALAHMIWGIFLLRIIGDEADHLATLFEAERVASKMIEAVR